MPPLWHRLARATSLPAQPAFRYQTLFLILLLSIGAWLRLAYLDYSEFQGDETIAITRLAPGQSLLDFLQAQKKGPIQFLLTFCLGRLDPAHDHVLLWRLPFALAGLASVWIMYRLVSLYFGTITGLYAGFLVATNGLFVAFSRIVQFQSIVVLGTLLALYWLSLAIESDKYRLWGLYLGACAAIITCLAHFDGFAVVLPAAFLLQQWYRRNKAVLCADRALRHVLAAAALFTISLVAFYVPFFLSIEQDTYNYWIDRWLGKLSTSTTVFSYYNGWLATLIYLPLALLGGLSLWRWPRATAALILLWLIPPLFVAELVMHTPRTHIYTYILPGLILVALGFGIAGQGIERCLQQVTGSASWAPASHIPGIFLIALFFGISHTLLVDHRAEYPWQAKKFLGMKFHSRVMAGVMGFPYRREWALAAKYLDEHAGSGVQYYVTNERARLVDFYMPPRFKNAESTDGELTAELPAHGTVYVLKVERPQSWRNVVFHTGSDKWPKIGTLIRTFEDARGRATIKVFSVSSDAAVFRSDH